MFQHERNLELHKMVDTPTSILTDRHMHRNMQAFFGAGMKPLLQIYLRLISCLMILALVLKFLDISVYYRKFIIMPFPACEVCAMNIDICRPIEVILSNILHIMLNLVW